jgi:GAF domain-containing protein
MEPTPETLESLRELTRFGDDRVARVLWQISSDVQRIVPEIVGISLSLVDEDLTFTMTASAGTAAELDGVQYLAGGPCEETLRTGAPHGYRAGDVVDEERWQLFARATAASGIESTLSLPIVRDGTVVAGVNLYASTSDAFEGRHAELADACGAWAGGAVTNADLDFSTRFRAAETPDRLRAENWLNQAVGALMSHWGIRQVEAQERLRQAAQRAGVSDVQMARAILGLFTGSDDVEGGGPV